MILRVTSSLHLPHVVQVSGEAAHSVRDPRPVTASAVADGEMM